MSVTHDDTAGQGAQDRQRYQDKIRDRVKKALPDLVSNVPIITGDGSDVLSIPVNDSDLELPRYRPDDPREPQSGVGQGEGKPGDSVMVVPKPGRGKSPGTDPGDGDADHPVRVELTLDEFRALIAEDLALPPLPPKRPATLADPAIRWTSRARHGPQSQVDVRASLKQAILRSQAQHQPVDFTQDDLRYRSWIEAPRPVTQAAVYLLRDASGSMDEDKRYLSQMAAWRVVSGLQRHYDHLETRFWIHAMRGEEVAEVPFYLAQSAGGTAFAPVYEAMQDDMDTRYPEATWNRIVLQFSDGDLMDPDAAAHRLTAWMPSIQFFGFILTVPDFRAIHPRIRHWDEQWAHFAVVRISRRTEVAAALRRLMQGGESHANT